MKKLLALVALAMASPALAHSSETERNRKVITDFARIFYEKRDVEAAFKAHVVPDYI